MKILVFYITNRSGHHSAALAVKKAIEARDPASEVLCINAFGYFFPFAEKLVHLIYLFVIKRVPNIWGGIYDKPLITERSLLFKKWIHSRAIKKLKPLLESFNPDVFLCTQAFPCGVIADYKKKYSDPRPLVAVLTDFAPHFFWLHDAVDYYVVHCEESRLKLVERGVAPEKIKIFGIPIDPKFASRPDLDEIFANYGLEKDIPVLLIMGGGHGLGPIGKILAEIDEIEMRLQVLVICGINNRLYDWIRARRFRQRLLVFKFTDEVDRLMSVSRLIITKPGGITTAEALAKRLPMIILHPIPGQEARNTQVLVSSGAALKIDSPDEILPVLKKIFGFLKEERLFGECTRRLSMPNASLRLADFVLTL